MSHDARDYIAYLRKLSGTLDQATYRPLRSKQCCCSAATDHAATLSPDPVLLGEVREAIERALQCTPVIKPEYVGLAGLTYRSVIAYDCGDPWQILRDLLAKLPKLTEKSSTTPPEKE